MAGQPFGVRRFSAALVFSSGQRKTKAAEKRRTPNRVPYVCPRSKFVSAARRRGQKAGRAGRRSYFMIRRGT